MATKAKPKAAAPKQKAPPAPAPAEKKTTKREPLPAIGLTTCPTCQDPNAQVKAGGAKAKAMVSCAACGYQGYARNEKSDALIRKQMRAPGSRQDPKRKQSATDTDQRDLPFDL